MVEHSSAPYQFFPPEPLWPVIKAARPLNWLYLRYWLGVKERFITGEVAAVRSLLRQNQRILFTPNHPTRTDPQLMGQSARIIGAHTVFMAAYDIFLESRVRCWFMQKTGSFSIDRDGTDRKALSMALEILKAGKYPLTIFPEGNVYHLNDKLTPLMEGPAFLAGKAHQALHGSAGVFVVPVSIKYTQLTEVYPRAWKILAGVARDSACPYPIDPDAPLESVVAVGSHLLTLGLNKCTFHEDKVDLRGCDSAAINAELSRWTGLLLGELESDLGLEPNGETAMDRIRRLRMSINQFRKSGSQPPGMTAKDFQNLCERALLAGRLFFYTFSYLTEKPTLDRFVETVSRLQEDFYSQEFTPLGPRKAILYLGEPVSIEEALQAQGGRLRGVAFDVTATVARRIQQGLDAINQNASEAGSQLVTTLHARV